MRRLLDKVTWMDYDEEADGPCLNFNSFCRRSPPLKNSEFGFRISELKNNSAFRGG